MNSDEFWCRAFLVAMDNGGDVYGCERAANGALEMARRRRMVTAGDAACIEFTAQPGCTSAWTVTAGPADFIGREVLAGGKYYPLHDGSALRIEWNGGDRPTKALIERPLAVAIAGETPVDSPASEAVEFTAELDGNMWILRAEELSGPIWASPGSESIKFCDKIVRIQWGETCPPKPIKVWLERAKGGA